MCELAKVVAEMGRGRESRKCEKEIKRVITDRVGEGKSGRRKVCMCGELLVSLLFHKNVYSSTTESS